MIFSRCGPCPFTVRILVLSLFLAGGLLGESGSLRQVSLSSGGEALVATPLRGGWWMTVAGCGQRVGQPQGGLYRLKAMDPVSRLVLLEGGAVAGAGLGLADAVAVGAVLKDFRNGSAARVERRVQLVSGRYLPFTVLEVGMAAAPAGTPLVDGSGRIAAVVSDPAGAGRMYAIPAEVMARVVDDLSVHGVLQRAKLGFALAPGSEVVKVTRVVPASPASEAGMLAGDVLRSIRRRTVRGYGDAVHELFLIRPGETVVVTVLRGKVLKEFRMKALKAG